MKRTKLSFFVGLLTPFIIVVLLGLFILDFGINSKYFIKKHFNNAFLARTTGNCSLFAEYLNEGINEWVDRCEDEKKREGNPIGNFVIKSISHEFLSDRAFLQVQLTRNRTFEEDYDYLVNYEMRKNGFIWKIDQEIK